LFPNDCSSIVPPVFQENEKIFDTNEKIWGGNLSLLIISAILAAGSGLWWHGVGISPKLPQESPREGKRRMTRLTDEEFHTWCQRNKIEPETAPYIQRLRTTPPERKVRGRASNVSGRYPSQKMGFSIQFESQHVELWGCYTMERDEDVLEMYDQPTRIQLHYHARSGRKTSPWHTPDFLVLRKDGAVFEEWKHASSLDTLAVTMPERYQRQAKGGWQCPPGEIAARSLGLSYRVRTSAESSAVH